MECLECGKGPRRGWLFLEDPKKAPGQKKAENICCCFLTPHETTKNATKQIEEKQRLWVQFVLGFKKLFVVFLNSPG
jgi:hypothetical protein